MSKHSWVNDLKVVELKEQLKERGLTVSGSKAVLQERLLNYLISQDPVDEPEEGASDAPSADEETAADDQNKAADPKQAEETEEKAPVVADQPNQQADVEDNSVPEDVKQQFSTEDKQPAESIKKSATADNAAESQSKHADSDGDKIVRGDPDVDAHNTMDPHTHDLKDQGDDVKNDEMKVDDDEMKEVKLKEDTNKEPDSKAGSEAEEPSGPAEEPAAMETDVADRPSSAEPPKSPSASKDTPASKVTQPSTSPISPSEKPTISEPSEKAASKPEAASDALQEEDVDEAQEEQEPLDYEDDVDMDADKQDVSQKDAKAAEAVDTPAGETQQEDDASRKEEDVKAGSRKETTVAQQKDPATPSPLTTATSADAPMSDSASADAKKKRSFVPIPNFAPRAKATPKSKQAAEPPTATKAPANASEERPEKQQRVEAPDTEAADATQPAAAPKSGTGPSAVRVDGFVRPLREPDVRQLMEKYGTVTDLWMPTLKTHCYAIYAEGGSAEALVKDLMDKDWQGLGSRLNPKVVPVSNAEQSIAAGRSGGARKPVTATPAAVRTAAAAAAPSENAPKLAPVFVGVKNVNTGAKSDADTPAAEAKERPSRVPVRTPRQEPEPLTLDDLFKKTNTKPRIYWLPLTDAQVAARKAQRGTDEGGVLMPEAEEEAKANGVEVEARGDDEKEKAGLLRAPAPDRVANGATRGKGEERELKRSTRDDVDRREERDSKRVRRDDDRREAVSRGRYNDSDRKGRR